MGDLTTELNQDTGTRAKFSRHLLNDIRALELMLERGLIESDIVRIGAEQEFCLVNENWRPAKTALEILEAFNDPHLTTEIAKYNLELNLDPETLTGKCFSNKKQELDTYLGAVKKVAEQFGTKIILTGILPTISKKEVDLEYMTPSPRYSVLNEMIKALKGSDFELHIMGVEELSVNHDSVLFEACNTSFQMHLQIPPDDFISSYNWAQAISGPVLGISANSPLLMGRDLWSETRIALFQQSIDTRSSSYALKDQQPRVTFGNKWASGTIADIFKDDIANYNLILSADIQEDALEMLENGEVPKLKALQLNNGSIYRWNRACYGVGNGKAHIRIENRYIPSGPTTLDEMAVFAFWVGLMVGRPKHYDDMASVMDFREAKANFIKTARYGKESVLNWIGELISVRDLITRQLLPIAEYGLHQVGIDQDDIDKYLGVIRNRALNRTGAQWQIKNYRKLRKTLKRDDALLSLTQAMYENQQTGKSIFEWPEITVKENTNDAASQVGHIMTTQLFTVKETDLASLAEAIMLWKDIHHLPVENHEGTMTGILTWTRLAKAKDEGEITDETLIRDIMTRELVTVRPETTIDKAIDIMRKLEVGSLPVVYKGHTVGLVTKKDIIEFVKDD